LVRSIENAEKNPLKIQNWVEQVSNLHQEKMSSTVSFSKRMPGVESLMQVWPDKIESCLKEVPFPNENINIGVDNYAKLVCNMLDIPIHNLNSNKSVIEALHLFFTLYSEFKENQHFQRSKGDDNVQSMKFY
jgi:intraflagellar transport protein 46